MNDTFDAVNTIKERQRAWAARNGRTVGADGYCACADDDMVGR